MLPRAFGLTARLIQISLFVLFVSSCQEPFFLQTVVDGSLEGDEITAEEAFFDYYVMSPVLTSDPNIVGGEITGTFGLGKNGLSDGSFDIQWTVYTSKNNLNNPKQLLDNKGDKVQGVVPVADVPLEVGFAGIWPESGSLYVIVEINYSDYDASNNSNNSGPYTVQ